MTKSARVRTGMALAASAAVVMAALPGQAVGSVTSPTSIVPRAAVPPAWSSAGPAPAAVTAVGWDPGRSGTAYAGTTNGVVLRSIDAGATWTTVAAVSDERVADIAVRGSVVLAALATDSGGVGGVARSLDGGATWRLAGPAQGISDSYSYQVDIDPSNPDTALLGTHGGLFRSTNAGGTWSPVAVPGAGQVYDVLFDPTQANVAYAASNGEVARSTNGGASFTPFAGGAASAGSSRLSRIGSFLYASDFGALLRTDVSAAAWASAAGGLTLGSTTPG